VDEVDDLEVDEVEVEVVVELDEILQNNGLYMNLRIIGDMK
jgi:hypothetical protein